MSDNTINQVEVERIAGLLADVMRSVPLFTGPDALSAVFTFTHRFASAIILHTATGDRLDNARKMSTALTRMGAQIEFDTMQVIKERVH